MGLNLVYVFSIYHSPTERLTDFFSWEYGGGFVVCLVFGGILLLRLKPTLIEPNVTNLGNLRRVVFSTIWLTETKCTDNSHESNWVSQLSRTMDTLRSFKRCGTNGVYRQMSCRGITRQSAVLYRMLTQTIEAPKKRIRTVRVTNT